MYMKWKLANNYEDRIKSVNAAASERLVGKSGQWLTPFERFQSAYRLGILGPRTASRITDPREQEGLWKDIWALDTVPKLKHFLWRFANESLGVFERLQYPKIRDDGMCPRGCREAETIIHATVSCPAANPMWGIFPTSPCIANAPTTSPAVFLRWIFDNTVGNDQMKVLATLWAAWFDRNAKVMNNETTREVDILNDFTKMVTDFNLWHPQHIVAKQATPQTLSFESWVCPPRGLIKINVDAAVFEGNEVGLGCVARNHEGKILAIESRRLNGTWDPSTAEFAAARMGVVLAQSLGFQEVIIESDALDVVSALHEKKPFLNHLFLFVDDIRFFLLSFSCLLASHVKRKGNCIAHLAARYATRMGNDLLYLN